jgi:ABC-type maltose transport system permease subunit
MILIVKEKNKKLWIRKTLSYLALIIMFSLYYVHMSSEFQAKNEELAKELQAKNEKLNNKKQLTRKVERVIYKEAERCVDLISQQKVQSIEIKKGKLIIVCDWDTDIEPLFVRYGVMALIKSTPENIKISVDIKFIVESNYEV